MTTLDPEDIITAVRDDVTVEKSFEPDDFPVPAIAFTIHSERETVISIRLVDTVPDDVAPENIGFHPKYGAEFWDVEDGQIVFQRDLVPGEEYTTVYGLRGGDTETATKFMSDPTIESIEPPLPTGDDLADAAKVNDSRSSGDEAVELTVSGGGEAAEGPISANGNLDVSAVPEADDGPEAERSLAESVPPEGEASNDDRIHGKGSDETEGTSDFTDISERGESPVRDDETIPEDVPEQKDKGTALSSDYGQLVSKLAAEIRAGDVDNDDLMTLRDALGLDFASASIEARIEHLQSEVSNLSAYTDELEEFLDEEGRAKTLIAEARDGYEEVTDSLGELETQLSEARSEFDDRFESVDETIDERIDDRVGPDLETIRSDFESLENQLETERDARAEIEAELGDLSAEFAEVAEMRNRLTNALGGLTGGTISTEVDSDGGSHADSDDATGPSAADRGDPEDVTDSDNIGDPADE